MGCVWSLHGEASANLHHRLFGDGQSSCPIQNHEPADGAEIVEDDDDEEDNEDDDGSASETSSLVGNARRSRSAGSSLPTSRKPSPMPDPFHQNSKPDGVMGRIAGIFGGGSGKRDARGGYNTISDN